MITLTKKQLSEVMCKHAEKENGVNDLLEIMLESLMVAERGSIDGYILWWHESGWGGGYSSNSVHFTMTR